MTAALTEAEVRWRTVTVPKSEKYLEWKEVVRSKKVLWAYGNATTLNNIENSDVVPSGDLPWWSHTLIHRPEQRQGTHPSWLWASTLDVIEEIFQANGIGTVEILRVNLNTTLYSPNHCSAPHVDLDSPHQVLVVYLTTFGGGHTWVGGQRGPKPEEDTAIIFDGQQEHFAECPDEVDVRRIILNVSFSEVR